MDKYYTGSLAGFVTDRTAARRTIVGWAGHP